MDLAWICVSLSKFRGMSVLWKKLFFSIFSLPHRKNSNNFESTNIEVWRLAHSSFGSLCSKFFKNLWKLAISLKLWVPANSEVGWSRTMSAKMSVFRPIFWRKFFPHQFDPTNTPKCYTWLESYRSALNDGKKKREKKFTLWSVRFLMPLLDRLSTWPENVSYDIRF